MIILKGKPEKYYNEDLSKEVDVFIDINSGEPRKFYGQTVLGNNVPFQFELEVKTLEEAFEKYDEVLEAKLTVLREDYEAAQSNLVVPDNKQIIT